MAKQKSRLRENYVKELVGLDSIIINIVEVEQKGKKVKMPMASISGANLDAQVDLGAVIETTTAEGKNVYYKLRPTLESGIAIPREEGYYSLEDTDIWLDKQEENKDKHILRFSCGTFKLTGKFKEKEKMPFTNKE